MVHPVCGEEIEPIGESKFEKDAFADEDVFGDKERKEDFAIEFQKLLTAIVADFGVEFGFGK
jgi:hypothetical protein